MNKINPFTLGRNIDPKYIPNQLIIIIVTIAFISGIIFHLIRENTIENSLLLGLVLGLITFLTWALTREIYPQSEYAALTAALSVIVALFWFGIYPIIAIILMWFTISLRLINQTTGLKATKIDMGIILIFSLICAYIFSWIFLIFLAIIFFINYFLTKDISDIYLQIPVIVAIIVFLYYQEEYFNQSLLNFENILFVGFLSIIFIIMMWFNRNIYVIGDHSNKKVPANRIFCAQILSVVFIFIYSVCYGDESITYLIPIWCIIIFSIIFSSVKILFQSYGQK
jgi:MFS family permease